MEMVLIRSVIISLDRQPRRHTRPVIIGWVVQRMQTRPVPAVNK